MSDKEKDNVVEFRRKPNQEDKQSKRVRPRTYEEAFAAIDAKNRAAGSRISGFKPGQRVICRIDKIEPDGYGVTIRPHALPGYLPSEATHKIGDEVLAKFVCVEKLRVLLTDR